MILGVSLKSSQWFDATFHILICILGGAKDPGK